MNEFFAGLSLIGFVYFVKQTAINALEEIFDAMP